MKNADEIRRILTEELGFRTLADYKTWIEQVRPGISPTPERIEKLSPDKIDCRAFWRVCEELFGNDPICNTVVAPRGGSLPYPVETHMDSNRTNLRFAKSFGVTAFLDEFADARLKTLEIGPGYGALKSYIETHTKHDYIGVDVVARFPGVVEATAEGFMPEGLVDQERGLCGYVVSSNVFQHLSAKQRTRYFKDAYTLLRKGGLFIFNMRVDTGQRPANTRDAKGNAWCDHYGQYTLIPRPDDLQREIASAFDILYATQRYDGIFNLVCQKPT